MKLESKLITRRMPWHANMTDMNHLGKALVIAPEVLAPTMNKLFSATEYYSGNPITAVLTGMKAEETIDKTSWEWDLKGVTSRPLICMENVEPAAITQPGKFKTVFKISLDEDWYLPGDVIHPGTSTKKYLCRIQESLGRQGKGHVYVLRLMSDDPQAFLPVKYLTQGQKWAKMFAQYEEAAEQSGSTQYALGLSMANKMSRYRKMYSVTGDAAQEVLSVQIPDSKGNFHRSWIKYAEVEYWQQWYREMEAGIWYSRSTDTVRGANGRMINSGPGIQEQLEDSHIHYYSRLTTRLIEEYLMDIFYSRVKPGSGRKIKAFTGEWGMLEFHRAIENISERRGIRQVDNFSVQKTTSNYAPNALSYGYQFTKYLMGNGAELELIHQPLYDDQSLNFEIDPVTGYPMESMRFTFLDFSANQGSQNVKLMNKRNSFKLGYKAGLMTPYGPVNDGLIAHSGDWYEMHVQKQCGVHINDITRCGELILSRN